MTIFGISSGGLSMGGLFAALAIPTWHFVRWVIKAFKAKSLSFDWHSLKDLIPLSLSTLYGFLASATSSGVIGFVTGLITWGGNAAGSLAMWGATGGHTTLPARSNHVVLTAQGNLVFLLLTVAIVAGGGIIAKKSRKVSAQGVCSGVLLGLSATLGGHVASTLIPMVNNWGDTLVGRIA